MIIPALRTSTDLITVAYMRSLDDRDLEGLKTALRQNLSDLESIQNERRNPLHLVPCPPQASPTRLRLVHSRTGREVER
jgi:hypothetical protein